MSIVHSKPRSPRGHGKIERVFRNLNQALPAIRATQVHGSTQLTLEGLRAAIKDFIKQNNVRRGQSESGPDIEGDT